MARREGSPWHGLGVVFMKELADHLTGFRMLVLGLVMMMVTAFVAVILAIPRIKEVTAEDPFLYLRLFTQARPGFPLVWFLSLLIPLLSIGLGFDLVNSEHARRTLSRILAQPIYRDALLLGKFLAALATIAINLTALWLLVVGLGLLILGVPPGLQELLRCLALLGIAIIYAGVWLALAMLFSILFRSAAAAALLPLGLWLFLTFLWPQLAAALAAPLMPRGVGSPQDLLDIVSIQQGFARVSPSNVFLEVVSILADPSLHSTQQQVLATMGLVLLERGLIPGAPIAFGQSLLIVWPQIVALIAATILLFAIGYVAFQRQEVRA
jgi:ABC-2 type transport system permease protein